jgi:pimeloyl-ACP methyl ester carboxylesterase
VVYWVLGGQRNDVSKLSDATYQVPVLPPRPSLVLAALETPRAFVEIIALTAAAPFLYLAAALGEEHPVLVLPGFTADDDSTVVLRGYLRQLGYRAHGWRLGRNFGHKALSEQLFDRLEQLHSDSGKRVSLVGWSLGGILARELAREYPTLVRQVISLGSPFASRQGGTNVPRVLFRILSGRLREEPIDERIASPPPVHSTAIYSRTDGVAHWLACVEREAPHTDNIEVPGSHCGLGVNPFVFYAIADRLAEPTAGWRRFDKSGWRSVFYG